MIRTRLLILGSASLSPVFTLYVNILTRTYRSENVGSACGWNEESGTCFALGFWQKNLSVSRSGCPLYLDIKINLSNFMGSIPFYSNFHSICLRVSYVSIYIFCLHSTIAEDSFNRGVLVLGGRGVEAKHADS